MYRLLNALCQVAAYALDLNHYSKEFMFGTSWAVSEYTHPSCLFMYGH